RRQGVYQLLLKHRWQHGHLSVGSVAMIEAQQVDHSIGEENVDGNGTSFMLRSTAAVEVSEKLAVVGGMDASASHYLVSARLPSSTLRLEGEPSMGRPDEAPTDLPRMNYDRIIPAFWGELRWKPLARLTITPGVRFDEFNYITDQERSAHS